MMHRTSLLALAAAALVAFGGCVVSPQPSPPGEEPFFDGGLVGVDGGPEALTDSVHFEAGPGAVEPAEGVMIITNIERSDTPTVVAVRDDGSFSVAVLGFGGDTFRFQAENDAGRSDALDLLVSVDSTTITTADGGRSCLALTTDNWLGFSGQGDAQSVLIRNDCPDAVNFQAPRLRRGQAGFTFAPTGANVLASGETLVITVTQSASATENEDVLYLEFTDPEASRRMITLVRQ